MPAVSGSLLPGAADAHAAGGSSVPGAASSIDGVAGLPAIGGVGAAGAVCGQRHGRHIDLKRDTAFDLLTTGNASAWTAKSRSCCATGTK